jgi:ParB family chromosome partitioning protein
LDNLEELAESIKAIGLLQPIVVRTNNYNNYEVVAGTRRLNACKTLGWRKISCHLVELDDKQAFEVSLVENLQRNTLNPIEEGLAYRKYVQELGWGGVSQLAEILSKSSSYVSKRIKLVDLPKDVIELISLCEINVSSAEELLSVTNKITQSKLAKIIHDKKLSTVNIRELIRNNRNTIHDKSMLPVKSNQYLYSRDKVHKSFDKSIIALKVAQKKLGSIVEAIEEDWFFYDVLLHHRNMLNSQIDLLIKEKRKIRTNSFDRFRLSLDCA